MYPQKTESSGVRSGDRNGLVLGTLLPIRLRGNFRSMTSRSAVWKSGGVPHRLAVISFHCVPVLQNLMAWGTLQRIWVSGAQIFQNSKSHVKILGAKRVIGVIRSKFPTDDPLITCANVQNLVVTATCARDVCTTGLSTLYNSRCVRHKRQGIEIWTVLCDYMQIVAPTPRILTCCRLTCWNERKVPSSWNTIIWRGGRGSRLQVTKDITAKCVTNSCCSSW
jgi:hypothetical protein